MEETPSPEPTEKTEEEAVQTPGPDTVITPETQDEPNGDSIPAKSAGYPPVTKPKKSKKGMIFLIIVLLALAGAAYYWFMVRKDTKTNNQTQTTTKKDVELIRYGTFEGIMNNFAPQQDPDSVTTLMNRQVFEPLVDFRDKTKLTPVLAASWTNPDSTTWIFTLKPNIKFHNGDTLTAKDVVYSYNEIKKNEDFADQVTSTIKSIEAIGDNQVKITTNGVDPILLNRLTSLLIVDSKAAGKTGPEYGTGAYTVKTGSANDANHIDLVAVDNWYGGHVYTKEVQITVYNDETKTPDELEKQAGDDMKSGKLDIVGFVADSTANTAKTAGFDTVSVEDNSIYFLVPNTLKKGSPLANAKVRQAINQAIDAEALLKAIGRTGSAESQVVRQFIPGYNSTVTRPKYDVAAAKQLLKDAGYPNGTSFTLTVFVSAKDAGEELVRQLALAGITVKLDVKNDVNTLQTGVNNGTFEAFYFADGSIYNDARDVFGNELQSANYKNTQIDTLLAQSDSTLDGAKRLDLLKQVSKLAMDDTAIVPLYSNNPKWITKQPYVLTQDLLTADLGVLFYNVHTTQ